MSSRALRRHRREQADAEQDQAVWGASDAVVVSAFCAIPDLGDADGHARARILTERQVRAMAGDAALSGVRWHVVPALPPGGIRRALDEAVGLDPVEVEGLLRFAGRNPAGALVAASIVVDPELAGESAREVAARIAEPEPQLPPPVEARECEGAHDWGEWIPDLYEDGEMRICLAPTCPAYETRGWDSAET